MAIDWPKVTGVATAGSAIVSLAALLIAGYGAYNLYGQLQLAQDNIYSTNQYKVEVDLASALDKVGVNISNAISSSTPSDKRIAESSINLFDAQMQATEALHGNKGISNETWKSILVRYCPKLHSAGYKIAGLDLGSTSSACEEFRKVWQGDNR